MSEPLMTVRETFTKILGSALTDQEKIDALFDTLMEPGEKALRAEGENIVGDRRSIGGYLDDFVALDVWQAILAALREGK